MRLRVGVATDIGRVRDHNEDASLAENGVFVVADGMGGHAAGEVASALVVETLRDLADRAERGPEDVEAVVRQANDRLLDSAEAHRDQEGMGTTLTGVVSVTVDGAERWAVVNVGDSRVYRWADGKLDQVTVDHSEVRELVDLGWITREQARYHPLRNIVTRSIGTDPGPEPDVTVREPEAGERFVICSDGLSDELRDEAIATVLGEHPDAQEAADALVAAALEAGGRDNVTVVVVDVDAAG